MLSRILAAFEQRRRREQLYSTAAYWDGKAKALSGSAISMWRNQRLNEHYEREQFRFLDGCLPSQLSGLDALDLGCGTGRAARYLHARGARTMGVDFSGDSLDVARRIGPDSIRYERCSALELDMPNSFDVIVGLGVLTVACKSEADLDLALSRIFVALKPNGYYLLIEPIHAGFLHRVLNMGASRFCERMKAAGFEIVKRRELHFWPARVPLALSEWPKFVTDIGYTSGQLCLSLGGRFFGLGDYKGIYARRRA
jgi:SAM-dependent methyltransferase